MINFKKILAIAMLVFSSSVFMVAMSPKASADSDSDRRHRREERREHRRDREDRRDHDSKRNVKITSISELTRNSAVINFRAKRFRDQSVTAIVSVKEKSTDNLVEKAAKARINSDGNGSAKVTGLKPGTRYEFKVRIEGDTRSSKNSSDKAATTSS